jgi:hypothetical protein
MFITFLASLVIVQAATESSKPKSCGTVLRSGGASPRFGYLVGHSVHSLTVSELQKFEPSTTANNSVPTIDPDLLSTTPIRLSAPDDTISNKNSKSFFSDGMRAIDDVMSHMDNPNYDVKYFSVMERVVHAFHMREIWAMAKDHYDQHLRRSPPTAEFCACATDTEHNGIMKELRFAALGMREPVLVYGQKPGQRNYNGYYVQYQVTYSFGSQPNDDASDTEVSAPFTPDSALLSPEDSMPELTDGASWQKWRQLLLSMDPACHVDVALYLYCALH